MTTIGATDSPNHRAMLQRIAETIANHDGRPATEAQIIHGMTYTLGSHATVVPPGAGPGPLAHLLADLAAAGLIEPAPEHEADQPTRWSITPAGATWLGS